MACQADTKPAANETTTPAPGVAPQAAETGTDDLTSSTLVSFPKQHVTGCNCSLRKDGAPDEDLFFVFNWQTGGTGVISLNGQEILVAEGAVLSSGQQAEGFSSYLHENEQYRIQTSLNEEGASGDAGSMQSGKVKVTDKASGAKLVVNVTGLCSC